MSVRRQCMLLGVNRNRLEACSRQHSEEDLHLARRMDEIALEFPEYRSRRYVLTLYREGKRIGRDRVRGLMRIHFFVIGPSSFPSRLNPLHLFLVLDAIQIHLHRELPIAIEDTGG